MDLLKSFLNLLSVRNNYKEGDIAEFQIDDTYSVPGVGKFGGNLRVLAGTEGGLLWYIVGGRLLGAVSRLLLIRHSHSTLRGVWHLVKSFALTLTLTLTLTYTYTCTYTYTYTYTYSYTYT